MRCNASSSRVYSIKDALLHTFFHPLKPTQTLPLSIRSTRSTISRSFPQANRRTYINYRAPSSHRSTITDDQITRKDDTSALQTTPHQTDPPPTIDAHTTRRYRNELIPSRHIHLVSQHNNSLSPAVSLSSELRALNPQTHYLEAVSTNPSTGFPIVKLVDKTHERERLATLKKRKRETKQVTKYLEMNWAIAPADLAHRLRRAKEFLDNGARVEILLARKRKGQRRAGVEEAEATLARVRDGVLALGDGVKEWAPRRGQVGGELHLFFEGSKGGRKGEGEKGAAKD